jgi:hypothetical protein
MSGGIVANAVGLTATTVVAEPAISVAHEPKPKTAATRRLACRVAERRMVVTGDFIVQRQ